MRSVCEWDISDLQQLIDDGVQESLTLDYKRSAALNRLNPSRNELSKDVAAFANSAGGMIIYGISENSNLPEALDDGSDVATISREWIEQSINSTIQPRIQNIVIQPIEISVGKYAYVIDIPQASTFAPHQSGDKKYYRRFNFTSVPMEDYEIRDVMRRQSFGQPVITVNYKKDPSFPDNPERGLINFWGTNSSLQPVYHLGLTALIDNSMDPLDSFRGHIQADLGGMLSVGEEYISVSKFRFAMTPSNNLPLFKEQNFKLISVPVTTEIGKVYHIAFDAGSPGFRQGKALTFVRNEMGTVWNEYPTELADL